MPAKGGPPRLPAPERRILRPAEGEALVGHVERALGDRGRDLEVDRGRPRDLDTRLEGRRREGETPLASSHEIHRVDEDVDHGVSLGMLNRHSYYVDDVTNERRYGVA